MTSGRIQNWIIQHNSSISSSSDIIEMTADKPVHPCFLYESIWCFALFLFLTLYMDKRRQFSGQLALLYTVTKPYSFDSAEFETIFVIRTEDGKLVSTSAHARSWDDMWDNGYCTETVSGLPGDKGSYTLSIYIENGLLAELPFTIK